MHGHVCDSECLYAFSLETYYITTLMLLALPTSGLPRHEGASPKTNHRVMGNRDVGRCTDVGAEGFGKTTPSIDIAPAVVLAICVACFGGLTSRWYLARWVARRYDRLYAVGKLTYLAKNREGFRTTFLLWSSIPHVVQR